MEPGELGKRKNIVENVLANYPFTRDNRLALLFFTYERVGMLPPPIPVEVDCPECGCRFRKRVKLRFMNIPYEWYNDAKSKMSPESLFGIARKIQNEEKRYPPSPSIKAARESFQRKDRTWQKAGDDGLDKVLEEEGK